MGAGASVPANLPTMDSMTSRYYSDYVDSFSPEEKLVVNTLKGIVESYYSSRHDIESFMSLIKSLEDPDLKRLITHQYAELNKLDHSVIDQVYKKTQQYIRTSLEKIEWRDIGYLLPMLGFLEEQPLEIFTLNYDGIIDLFCEKNHLRYSDGFDPFWNPKVFEENLQVRIYRLHGSLYWFKTLSENIIRIPVIGLDLEHVKYISLENMSEMLIYPTMEKEKYSEIYTWLNNRFISKLNETNLLIIIGYSFRDQDITTMIKEALMRTKLWIIIVSPNANELKGSLCLSDLEISSRVIAIGYGIDSLLRSGLFYQFYNKLKNNIQLEEKTWGKQHQIEDPLSEWTGIIQAYYDLECNERIDYVLKNLENYFPKKRVEMIKKQSTNRRNLWRK